MTILPSAGLRARVALDKHAFRTTHSLGQNFLLDDAFLSRLLDETGVGAGDCVLEIGPGAGVMTALIAERAEKVLAVELDQRLEPVLSDVLRPHSNASVLFCDFLKSDVDRLIEDAFGAQPYRVIANLPYYITADILMRLTTADCLPESISIMVQKEAAERIMSAPGEKQWCALAATIRLYGSAEILEEVPRDRFDPAPHVDSCFIQIRRHEKPIVETSDLRLLRRTIQCAFAMRRKTLANNLKASFSLNAEEALSVLERAGVPANARGEALDLAALCRVSEALKNR